ncbi:unnamed protein product, partial [marine sediment metagenome]
MWKGPYAKLPAVLIGFAIGLFVTKAGAMEPLRLTPQTAVVVPDGKLDRHTQSAAATLRDWLRKATASEGGFNIISQGDIGDAPAGPVLAVGSTRWTDPHELAGLWRDGYVLRRKGNVIVIAGGRPSGTFHGACGFLDRFCGVRFYMPTELFTSLPGERQVAVREVDLVMDPFVKSCYMSGINYDDPRDSPWVRRVGGWRRLGGTHQH